MNLFQFRELVVDTTVLIKQCYGLHWYTIQHQIMLHFTQEPTDQYIFFFFQFKWLSICKRGIFCLLVPIYIYLLSYSVLNAYFGELFVLSRLRASLLAVDHLTHTRALLTVYRNHQSFSYKL